MGGHLNCPPDGGGCQAELLSAWGLPGGTGADDIAALVGRPGLDKPDRKACWPGGVVLHTAARYPDLAVRLVVASATVRHSVIAAKAHSRGARLLAGASRAELDPGQDANADQQQPGREQHVHREAEDGQGHDGQEDQSDDRQHGDRSPFHVAG